jgi:hypothetical protein
MAVRVTSTLLAIGAMIAALAACATTTKGHSINGVAVPASTAGGSKGANSSKQSASSATQSSGRAGPDGAAHPCSLLTQSEAETLAGTKLMAGIESGASDAKTLCQYVGPTTGPEAQVQVLVGDGAKKVLDIDRDVLKHPFTTLTGVGDEAYQEDDNVFIRKGATWASINLVLLNEPAQNVKPMQTAAREVARRLG